MINAEDLHERTSTLVINLFVLLVVSHSQTPGGAANSVENRLRRHDLGSHRSGGQSDASSYLGRIRLRQIRVRDSHLTGVRRNATRCDARQRGLARTVWTNNDPVLTRTR